MPVNQTMKMNHPTTNVESNEELTVYLAGPIHQVDDETAKTWREELKESSPSDIEFIDPLDSHDSTDNVKIVRDGFKGFIESVYDDDTEIVTDSEIVETDLSLIDESDVVIASWPSDVSFTGTKMEVFYAARNDVHVIAVFHEKIIDAGPWFHYHVDTVKFSFTEAVRHVRYKLSKASSDSEVQSEDNIWDSGTPK